jgi:hypothetical protein
MNSQPSASPPPSYTLPAHITVHESPTATALMVAAYFRAETGWDAAYAIARAVCPHVAETVLVDRVDDIADLLDRAERFDAFPAEALFEFGVDVAPHCTVDQVSMDMRDSARDAARLAATLTASEETALARRSLMAVAS